MKANYQKPLYEEPSVSIDNLIGAFVLCASGTESTSETLDDLSTFDPSNWEI